MKKAVWIGIAVIVVVAAAYVLRPGSSLRGQLSGEAFFAGHPTSYWSAALRSDDPGTKETARRELEAGGKDALPVLSDLLLVADGTSWDSAEVRATAAEVLLLLGPDAAECGDAVLQATRDEDPIVRNIAASALPAVGYPAEEAVPRLVEMLKYDPSVRISRALSEYGPDAAPALEALSSVLKDRSHASDVRWNAARTLGKLREQGAAAIPVLLEHLDDETDTIREHCAEALGDIGKPAQHTAPQLIAKLTDSAYRVRKDAARSLGQIGADPATTVPELKKLLDDEEQLVRDFARTAIKALAPDEELPEEHPADSEDAAP